MKVISDAHTCKDRRTYVQGRLQVRAEKVASISVEEAVHCIFSRKRLHPLPQTFAVKRRLLWNPFPSCFSAEPKCAMGGM